MATGTLGVKSGNVIVPVTNYTKRTKQLTITTYITASGWTCRRGVAVFYADSDSNWRMKFNARILKDSGTATSVTLAVAGVVFKNIATYGNYQALSAMGNGPATAINAFAENNTGNIQFYADAALDSIEVAGDVELNAEPAWTSLGTTVAAALENLAGVDVYIPFGQTGSPGEEKIAYATTTTTTAAATEIDVTGASITLTPGIWDLSYYLSYAIRRESGTTDVYGRIRVTDSSNTNEQYLESYVYNSNPASGFALIAGEASKIKRITVTGSNKTFKVRVACAVADTTGNISISTGSTTGTFSGDDAASFIRAVRIA
jgi:hypothetical protein